MQYDVEDLEVLLTDDIPSRYTNINRSGYKQNEENDIISYGVIESGNC